MSSSALEQRITSFFSSHLPVRQREGGKPLVRIETDSRKDTSCSSNIGWLGISSNGPALGVHNFIFLQTLMWSFCGFKLNLRKALSVFVKGFRLKLMSPLVFHNLEYMKVLHLRADKHSPVVLWFFSQVCLTELFLKESFSWKWTFVILYSPSCRSKPVWLSFFWGTREEMFL